MLLQDSASTQECLDRMTSAFDEAELFFGHGTDNAWDEACWLLETLARRRQLPPLQLDTTLAADFIAEVERMANLRLTTRKPMAYLLQEAWFCDVAFYVDERVLVPRSPFAELIRNRFEPLLPATPGMPLPVA